MEKDSVIITCGLLGLVRGGPQCGARRYIAYGPAQSQILCLQEDVLDKDGIKRCLYADIVELKKKEPQGECPMC